MILKKLLILFLSHLNLRVEQAQELLRTRTSQEFLEMLFKHLKKKLKLRKYKKQLRIVRANQ